jgi:hypothetical protein
MFTLIKNLKTKAQARSHAIDWQNWQSTQSLSYGEVTYFQNFFIRVGRKFKLSTEFRENGII